MADIARIHAATGGLLAAIAEAVQRSDEAARALRSSNAPGHLVDRLQTTGAELNATYVKLFRASSFGPAPVPAAEQLALAVDDADAARRGGGGDTIPSAVAPTLDRMNEEHMEEVERILFIMSETRRQAERAARDLARDGAEPHLVAAVEQAERQLEATIDAFFKGTYFHVPKGQREPVGGRDAVVRSTS